jgi:mycoredoxin
MATDCGRLPSPGLLKPEETLKHLKLVLKNLNLTVYTAPWCRDCHTAKRWLVQHQIAYKEINIEEIPGAAEEVIRRTGKRAIPQFVLDGKWIQPYVPGHGFLYQEMAELFGVGQ